ncbi:proline racemase family protein [Aliikangiella coralliicola]|uniref:Proline racemase n=1 Tax=Aliikangiella coralliicola TaxID=2592383 RepID=A0A545UHR1_9GAMM|nr:proline racemase family protein [Aliikangiella coralliicola]TQV89014.1 proline racemase [Aliikangiella coralliicola]
MSSDFINRFKTQTAFRPLSDSHIIDVIDMHTGGEPLRVVINGYPQVQADSLLEYRKQLKQNFDHFRTAIMFEPRGHADMYGCLLLPPFNSQADCSAIFMHNEGYSSMCGHAVIGIMTLAIQMNWVEVHNDIAELTIEAPCGLIKARGCVNNGDLSDITASFECVPSFVTGLNESVHIESLSQNIRYDLAYGGAFYAYVDAEQLGLDLVPENNRQLIELGTEIKNAVLGSSEKILHPYEPELSFLYGTIFIGGPISAGVDSRNVCIFADGEVDRSPTGSGVSGRMALHYAKGEIKIGESMKIESILGSQFITSVQRVEEFGSYQAVIPKVSGNAFVCGVNQLIINPNDKLRNGFFLR